MRPLLPVEIVMGEQKLRIEFVIDTGFTDYLTLPQEAIDILKLEKIQVRAGRLADGSLTEFPVYAATVVWFGIPKLVPVLSAGKRPLLGTALLAQSELNIRFIPSGNVTVTSIEED
jgi:clan AA aspartic protease